MHRIKLDPAFQLQNYYREFQDVDYSTGEFLSLDVPRGVFTYGTMIHLDRDLAIRFDVTGNNGHMLVEVLPSNIQYGDIRECAACVECGSKKFKRGIIRNGRFRCARCESVTMGYCTQFNPVHSYHNTGEDPVYVLGIDFITICKDVHGRFPHLPINDQGGPQISKKMLVQGMLTKQFLEQARMKRMETIRFLSSESFVDIFEDGYTILSAIQPGYYRGTVNVIIPTDGGHVIESVKAKDIAFGTFLSKVMSHEYALRMAGSVLYSLNKHDRILETRKKAERTEFFGVE